MVYGLGFRGLCREYVGDIKGWGFRVWGVGFCGEEYTGCQVYGRGVMA